MLDHWQMILIFGHVSFQISTISVAGDFRLRLGSGTRDINNLESCIQKYVESRWWHCSTTKIYPFCQEAFRPCVHLFVHSIPNYLFDKKRSSRPPWTSKATTKVPSSRKSKCINICKASFVLGETSSKVCFGRALRFSYISSLLSFTASGNQDLTWMLSLVGPQFASVTSLDNPEKHLVEVTPPDITIIHLNDPTGMTYDDHWLQTQ